MAKQKFRKTKLVQVREPNGRSQRSTDEKEYAPTRVRRLLDASMTGMADAEWGTPLGRLYVRRKVTAPMYAAGKRWAERVVKYHSAINAPPPDPKALAIGGGGHGKDPDPDSDEGQKRVKRDADAVTDFMAAHSVLVAAGKLPEHEVRRVCEHGAEPDGHEGLLALNRGLLWLAEYWGLTNQRKSDVR